jgi:hypothetical protein
MADIRIKDLTTLESASLTGDVFVIDGTTGTRKLSAFSPSFGGNATVTGTLTVSGTGASSFGGRLAIGATALSDRMFYVSGNTGTTGASQFSAVVNPTIPNTVTTGAYGLYLGTNIATGATVTNGYSLFIAAPDYTGSTVANKYGLYSNDPNPSYFVGNVLVGSTTASTTTSTGALVVSGGVGVAGAIYAGGLVEISGTNSVLRVKGANALAQTSASILDYSGGSARIIGYGADASTAAGFAFIGLSNDGSVGGTRLSISTAGNATFSGSVTTGTPTGGTAAAWKLGTVATVSPTSPNRTIEVDIGGTIYYIHAKTTNN